LLLRKTSFGTISQKLLKSEKILSGKLLD